MWRSRISPVAVVQRCDVEPASNTGCARRKVSDEERISKAGLGVVGALSSSCSRGPSPMRTCNRRRATSSAWAPTPSSSVWTSSPTATSPVTPVQRHQPVPGGSSTSTPPVTHAAVPRPTRRSCSAPTASRSAGPTARARGITALLADTGATEMINYVRSSRLPTPAEQTTATTNGWGGLHVYQFATDGLEMAVSNTVTTERTGGPAAHRPGEHLPGTYLKWGDVPGYTGPAPTATIKPFLPQAGSGTRNFFLADLQAANGGTAIMLGANVRRHAGARPDEHRERPERDRAVLGRPRRRAEQRLLRCRQPERDQAAVRSARHVQRHSWPVHPRPSARRHRHHGRRRHRLPVAGGGTKNWVQTMFSGTTSWIARSVERPLIASAGLVPSYSDLGPAPQLGPSDRLTRKGVFT